MRDSHFSTDIVFYIANQSTTDGEFNFDITDPGVTIDNKPAAVSANGGKEEFIVSKISTIDLFLIV